jgi:hypothetical protein
VVYFMSRTTFLYNEHFRKSIKLRKESWPVRSSCCLSSSISVGRPNAITFSFLELVIKNVVYLRTCEVDEMLVSLHL